MPSSPPFTYTVPAADNGRTVAAVLAGPLKFSRALRQKLTRNSRIYLNGAPVKLTTRVQTGDRLVIDLAFPEVSSLPATPLPLTVLYEDSDVLAVDKPADMLVHPVRPEQTETLANAVLAYFAQQNLTARFRPVYRLDRSTSGIILVAKNHFANQALARQRAAGQLERLYFAIVEGTIPDASGTIDQPIGRKPGSMMERMVVADGQPAITHFTVSKRLPATTLVALRLETGRTHQIRVHMQHIGHPLCGDTLYGGTTALISRPALHAAMIIFRHLRTGKIVRLLSPLPPDMRAIAGELPDCAGNPCSLLSGSDW